MFKNAKLLKGSTVALACALVLCLGIVFGIYYAVAAANTVTLYVSDHGDNTTGSDEASAFTSIMEATKAANKMALKPGTKLKLLIAERTTVTTSNLAEQVYDTEKNKVPVFVEGYGYDKNDGNRPEIYCTYRDLGNTSSYRQWMHLGCDMEFYGVKFLSKVHDETYGKGAPNEHYCTRYLNAGGFYAVFDDVVFTTEDPANIKWELRADRYSSGSVIVKTAGHSGFALKNGDYTNCDIKISQYATVNYDIDVSFENVTLSAVNILASGTTYLGNPDRDQKANSITVTFGKGTTVKGNVVPNLDDGYYLVPDGITVNFMEGCKIEGKVASTSKIKKKTVVSDHTFNFFGGTFEDTVYPGFSGTVTGALTNNVSGGTFGTFYGAGTVNDADQQGDVRNIVTGGTISAFHGTGNVGAARNVYNEISGGTIGTYHGASLIAGAENIYNNISGNAVIKKAFYGGGIGGSASRVPNIFNNITGVTFKDVVYLGKSQTRYAGAAKNIVNNIKDVTFEGAVYGGCGAAKAASNCENIENNFKNCTFEGAFYGGSEANSGVGTSGNIINNITDSTFAGEFHGGSSAGETGKITNSISGSRFDTTYYGGSAAETAVDGAVTNNISDCTITTYCGTHKALTDTLTNNIASSTITTYYGGGYGAGTTSAPADMAIINNFTGNSTVAVTSYFGAGYRGVNEGSVTNNISNPQATFTTFYGGASSSTSIVNYYDVTNKISAGTFDTFYGSVSNCKNVGDKGGNIINEISGGTFNVFYGAGNNGKPYTVTNKISGGTFNEAVYGGTEGSAGNVSTMVNEISGGTFEKGFYGTSKKGTVGSAVINIKPDDSKAALIFKGAVSSSTENVTTTIHGGNKPIHLASASSVYADALAGDKNIVFCQTAQWTDGSIYVSLPENTDMSRVFAMNKSSSVTGAAEKKVVSGRQVVAGATGTGAATSAVAPTLNSYSFVLDNKLKVNFLIPVSQIESYIELTGSWNYKVELDGEELAGGSFTSAIPAAAKVTGYDNIECFAITTDLGIKATDYDKKITITWSGKEDVMEMTAYGLLEYGIDSNATKSEIKDLLKAIYNYGIEAENVFEGKKTALKYADVTYTGNYNSTPTRTSKEEGFEFFATSLSLDDEVALNFYLKVADGVTKDLMTFVAKNASGSSASNISVKEVSGVAEYDMIVSVKLSVAEMADTYTLTATLDGAVVATCSNSIANSCAGYIATQNKFAPVSKALLAYIEKAVAAR